MPDRNARGSIVAIVAAMGENRVIGRRNRLPWHLPADLKHFKKITLGKPVVMGRRTFESIGRPLPGRTNIVVSRSAEYRPEGCRIAHDIREALAMGAGSDEIMIIGGATLYETCLPFTRRIYLTCIHRDFTGDARFPALDPDQWRQNQRTDFDPDERNPYPYSFIVLERAP